MTELELEIGRILGPGSFFAYQFIKDKHKFTSIDLEVETALSDDCIWQCLNKLTHANVIIKTGEKTKTRAFVYQLNREQQTWNLH